MLPWIIGGIVAGIITGVVIANLIKEKLREKAPDYVEDAFSAEIKDIFKSKKAVKVTVFDVDDDPLVDVTIEGDDIDENINVGDKIIL